MKTFCLTQQNTWPSLWLSQVWLSQWNPPPGLLDGTLLAFLALHPFLLPEKVCNAWLERNKVLFSNFKSFSKEIYVFSPVKKAGNFWARIWKQLIKWAKWAKMQLKILYQSKNQKQILSLWKINCNLHFIKVYFSTIITSLGPILKVYCSILRSVFLAHLAHLISHFQISA